MRKRGINLMVAGIFIFLSTGTAVAAVTVIAPEKKVILKTTAAVEALLESLSPTVTAYIIISNDTKSFTETFDVADPKRHFWQLRSKKTGKQGTIYFYPDEGVLELGVLNADALEDVGSDAQK